MLGGLLGGEGLGDGDDAVERGAQLVAHIGQEAGFLGVGLFQLGGAHAHPLLQRSESLADPFAAGLQGAGQDADLVAAAGLGHRLRAIELAVLVQLTSFGQALQGQNDGPPGQGDHKGRLQRRRDQAHQQHPGGRLGRRGGHGRLGIAHQQVPVGAAEAAEGDDVPAVGAGDDALVVILGLDGGDQGFQAQLALVAGDGLGRRAARRLEARIGDQVGLVGHHQVRRARQGLLDGVEEESGQLQRRAERADVAVIDIGRGDAAGRQALAVIVLDQALQIGAASLVRRIVGRQGDLGHFLTADVQVGRCVVAIEHQSVRPVGAEHDQPGLGREEVEVVVVGVHRLAEVRDDAVGGDQGLLLLKGQRFGVAHEAAHPIDVEALGVQASVEILRPGPPGAVRLQRIVEIEQALGGGRIQHGHAARQGVGGGLVVAGQV